MASVHTSLKWNHTYVWGKWWDALWLLIPPACPDGPFGLPTAPAVQRYVTVAQIGCQAAAAFAKHLVWSRDCSARLFVARSEMLSRLGWPPSRLCKSPCLPLAATSKGSLTGKLSRESSVEWGGSHPSAGIRQCSYFCYCLLKPFW